MAAVPSEGHAAAVPSRLAPEGEATRLLYERHQRKILSFCMHQLGNREEAEDATQVTFMNAFRGLRRGTSPEFESAWLFKIAHNVCLTRQRNSYRKRLVEVTSDFELIQERVPAHEGDTDELFGLQTALRAIPEQQRRALLLREWKGLSYKEIADDMLLSQAAVETLLFRARRSLADALTTDPSTRRKRGRPRATSNVGSIVAALKSLILGGSVKVAATVATVAATSVVTATPAVRQDVINAVTSHHASARPAAPARVLHTVVSAPIVALAPRAASTRTAAQHVARKASSEAAVPTPVTSLPAPAAETHEPSAPVAPAAPATPPAAKPAASDQLPQSVPTPAPVSSDPAPVVQSAAPAEAAPDPVRTPTSAATPSTASTPTQAPATVAATPVAQTPTPATVTATSPTVTPTTTLTASRDQPVPTGETTQTAPTPTVTSTPTVTTSTTQPVPQTTTTQTTTTVVTYSAPTPTPVVTQAVTPAPTPVPAAITPLRPSYGSAN